ncbi:hypothetical protein [Streptomyces sp. NPDC093261]|uniref:hypothetical protein n=1 Tax=Streptomyces sp. NPDC093261 TaxID=3366037 RepID=UPI003816D292
MSNKDVTALIRRLRRQGFTCRLAKSGHWRVTSPAGVTLTVPATPGGGNRGLRNTRADLRRIGAQL